MRGPRRFATKLFLAFAALVALAMGAAFLALERIARERADESFARRFEQARAAFGELARLRERFITDEIEALARGNPQFRTVLSTASLAPGLDLGLGGGDTAAAVTADANLRLRSLAPSLALAERCDVLVLLASDGRLLYSAADPLRAGEDLSALALFQDTLNRGGGAAVWTDRDPVAGNVRLAPRSRAPAVYEMVARPVVFEDAIHGVVIAGTRIDAATLAGLRSISGLDLALVAHGELVASTLAPADHAQLAREWRARGERTPRALGSAYRMRAAPLAPEREPKAQYVLLASLDEERAFVRRVRVSLLVAGAVILALSLAVAFTLARGITTPVRELARAARRLGAGDLDAEVSLASRDELGELAAAWNEMTRGLRERDRLRRTFERYVSKDVAAEILRHPELAPRAGEARELSVAFVDIGGFTQLAERLGAPALVGRLNEYFEAVCGAVLERNGTVNEFVGDGVVVYWGAPLPQPDHALRASLAALEARRRLAALAARWRAEGLPDARFRIGLHTGSLVIGEIGSEERRAYRAVGDAMNVAARIEGANKSYGTELLVSEATRAGAGDAVVAREVDLVRVVGRAQPVRLYELVCEAGAASPAELARLARYAEALALYRARAFAGAASAFADCAPDPAAAVLGARAARFAAAPPPADWDGVHELESK